MVGNGVRNKRKHIKCPKKLKWESGETEWMYNIDGELGEGEDV
jgi:hypothetical protein